ncbi:SafA/ExsA family spore coat assembly protein [Pseudogracilibacillus sp. SO10305]|uniref:SafA/ExsA family spore coat assembly protein n=1 Tax=Pseudogracilibacillus sp. SO10305 TaxID=3098292 RepID=UPI00300E3236
MQIHIVQKGDTLYQLSKQYGVDLDTLIQANPQIADPEMMFPGMKIQIPSKRMPIHPNEHQKRLKKDERRESQNENFRPMQDVEHDERQRPRSMERENELQSNVPQNRHLGEPRVVSPRVTEQDDNRRSQMQMPNQVENQMVRPNQTRQTDFHERRPDTIVYYCCCCKHHKENLNEIKSNINNHPQMEHREFQRDPIPNNMQRDNTGQFESFRNDTYFHEGGHHRLT